MSHKSRRKKLEELPDNTLICADANILAYYFIKKSKLSEISHSFLERSRHNKVNVVTSPQIVSDVIHRSILAEAQREFQLDNDNLVNYLKTHPDIVSQLKEHLDIPSVLAKLKVNILALTHVHHHAAKQFRLGYGMMANDSLILGLMRVEKIRHLATNDQDFRRVKGIMVWEP